MILIQKVHQPTSPADYRPIALLNTCYKLVDKIINKRIQKAMKKTEDQADEYLFGFKKGKSTIDSILLLKMIEEWAKLSGKFLCFLAIDVKKAYDRADQSRAIERLANICPAEAHIIAILWGDAITTITFEGKAISKYTTWFGLR